MRVRNQRGFTLIELMVALVISSLLVGMILAIFSRMSLAYRGQQQIAGLQQVLAAARATIEADAKQAGFGMPQGFKLAADSGAPVPRWPVRVYDSSSGPDQIAFFYGDPSVQAVVTAGTPTAGLTVTVDPTTGFGVGDLVIMTTPAFTTPNGSNANITTYDACVLQTTSTGATGALTFSPAPPYGRANQTHCGSVTPGTTMVYKFAARGYRIEPQNVGRAGEGPLQLSTVGGMFGDVRDGWTDLAFGFTDIQTALRIYDENLLAGAGDFDGDGDPSREWLSGPQQTQVTDNTLPLSTNSGPLMMTLSLVARTDRDVEGVSTTTTPQLTNTAKPNANPIGDHDFVDLTTTSDAALLGSRIYRYLTFQVDFRNLGVGH
jgi:prepilin-type N-terminal cleavage/methylation domain-containing protein